MSSLTLSAALRIAGFAFLAFIGAAIAWTWLIAGSFRTAATGNGTSLFTSTLVEIAAVVHPRLVKRSQSYLHDDGTWRETTCTDIGRA
jgi:hypothetical protein